MNCQWIFNTSGTILRGMNYMNALIKEEQKMDHLTKSYLQLYKEFISGYKQYKLEKDSVQPSTLKAESAEK